MPVASYITPLVFLVYKCATAHLTDLIMFPIVGEEKEVQMTAGIFFFLMLLLLMYLLTNWQDWECIKSIADVISIKL